MLYNWLYPLAEQFALLNVLKYLTFRSGAAVLTALAITLIIGSPFIDWLKKKQKEGQPIREDGPESHLLTKKGTPTMGGIMILFSVTLSTLLWADISNPYIWVVLLVTMGYGMIGAVDDYLKLTKRNTKGLSGKGKLVLQASIAVVAGLIVQKTALPDMQSHLALPFFKNVLVNLGMFYLPFIAIVIVGASNAVNLTDGLDGLAIGPIMIAAGCYMLIAYLTGNIVFADYLQLHHVPGAGELSVFCAALIGAGLGFLWYNAPPARVFMGDTGSLACGGALGIVSVIVKHEIVLAIIGGLFVMEAVSVILQVGYYKMTKKRIFRMAPIHHHFEKLGWPETRVVMRFWIMAVVFALIGLSTLKLR